MRDVFIAVFFIFVFLGLAVDGRADIYKFVDEDGVLHFTNVPNDSAYKWVMRESYNAPRELSTRESQVRYDYLISKAARKHGMDPALIKAVIEAESDFDPEAHSRAGAVGLMQLMPETARGLGVTDPYNPSDNIEGGVKHLKRLLLRFKRNVPLALAAYNAGEANVERYGKVPPFRETEGFVEKVLEYRRKYSGTFKR